MGQSAVYIAVDEARLVALWELEDEEFRESFLELEEDESLPRLDIGKVWDALHCTLTGISASDPIEDNPLSEAIVGVNPKIFEDDDYSVFASVTDNSDLERILAALEPMTPQRLASMLDKAKLKKQNVYPSGIWNEDTAALAAELGREMHALRQFYKESFEAGHHVLATIL